LESLVILFEIKIPALPNLASPDLTQHRRTKPLIAVTATIAPKRPRLAMPDHTLPSPA
jgi:hypothetical protein